MERTILDNPRLATSAALAVLFASVATLSSINIGESRSYIAADKYKHNESALSMDTAWRNNNENARNICLGLLVTDLVLYYTVQLSTAGGKRKENELNDNSAQVF